MRAFTRELPTKLLITTIVSGLTVIGCIRAMFWIMQPSPYRAVHTENDQRIDKELSEKFGQRLSSLGVANIVIIPELKEVLVSPYEGSCKSVSVSDDNDCYWEAMVAHDTQGETIMLFENHFEIAPVVAEITVADGRVTARFSEGTKKRRSFDSALEDATNQISKQVAILEQEAARRSSWTADTADNPRNTPTIQPEARHECLPLMAWRSNTAKIQTGHNQTTQSVPEQPQCATFAP